MTDLTRLKGATIAFDLDGTLVDSAPDLIGTLNHLLAAQSIAPLPLDQARPYIGHGARWLIERGFSAQGHAVPTDQMDILFERFITHYNAHSTDLTRPFPGVEQALSTLKDAGAKLVVCTNKRTALCPPILEGLNLARYFSAVVGADAVPAAKPDARHLLAAIAAADGDPARAVMVGDAATDAGAARNAGVPLILVSFGYTETPARDLAPDILVDHFDQMVEACANLITACSPNPAKL